ncbi:FkbM family methyltransferase [Mesorhizobium sp.]|uniref:FkbM family methyltransferase n=1 Tax=Mesorhizobium sp. TaxID=1871066 RepID=UPI00257F5038|nr:FkbM family methyltransferase [Mesorhizobium sp.]
MAHDVATLDLSSGSTKADGLSWKAALSILRQRPVQNRYVVRAVRKAVGRLTKLTSPEAMVRVRYSDGTYFSFPAHDTYWGRLLYHDLDVYEPEIEWFLRKFAETDFAFMDLGANMGYWSVRLSGREMGARDVVAVEAAADTFRLLSRNAEINGNRFKCVHRAISDTSGQTVALSGNTHAGKSITDGWSESSQCEMVETITIDALVAENETLQSKPLVIKLDVEGAEPAAFAGAVATLGRNSVFLYEDHGKDRSHKATAAAIKYGNVYHVTMIGFVKIGKIADLDQVKVKHHGGYNFILTASPFWIERIEKDARK